MDDPVQDDVKVRIRVRGRVQGVWYRGSTAARAEELGVVGWVRNLSDGSVEAWARGSREAVDALVAWCREGPPLARVDEVRVEAAEDDGGHQEFVVRRGR